MLATAPSMPPAVSDRRSRKHAARRDALLDLAAELIERDGVGGFTMASLADAADYAPASLYTYFDSRSAVFASLQSRALIRLREIADEHLALWDRHRPQDATAVAWSAARLFAYADLFLTAPAHHPREFRLHLDLLLTSGVEEIHDAATVIPAALASLEVPAGLLRDAAGSGLIAEGDPTDAIAELFGIDLARTFGWVVTLNGSLLVDSLIVGQPATGLEFGRGLTRTLLIGWGADPGLLGSARELADELAALDDSSVAQVLGADHEQAP